MLMCPQQPCHNHLVSVRTTIDILENLYRALRQRAARGNASIRSLVVPAIEHRFGEGRRGKVLTGPPLPGRGKPGPQCPDQENLYDVLFA